MDFINVHVVDLLESVSLFVIYNNWILHVLCNFFLFLQKKDYKKFNAFIQTDLGKEFLKLKKKEWEKKNNE